jgi:hypothetical protein
MNEWVLLVVMLLEFVFMKIQSLKDHCNPLKMQKHMSAAAEKRISFTVGGQKYCVFAFMAKQTVTRHHRYFIDLLTMHFTFTSFSAFDFSHISM